MKSRTAKLYCSISRYDKAKMQKIEIPIKNDKLCEEFRSQKSESRIPSQTPTKSLNHKAHKEHKDSLFDLLNPKSKILNPDLLFCL